MIAVQMTDFATKSLTPESLNGWKLRVDLVLKESLKDT